MCVALALSVFIRAALTRAGDACAIIHQARVRFDVFLPDFGFQKVEQRVLEELGTFVALLRGQGASETERLNRDDIYASDRFKKVLPGRIE